VASNRAQLRSQAEFLRDFDFGFGIDDLTQSKIRSQKSKMNQ